MAKEFTVLIEQDEEGYYIAEVPELKGCHTQAKSLDTLMERVKEAIQLCLEVYGKKYPIGETIGPGLLSKILRDVEMTKDELLKILE